MVVWTTSHPWWRGPKQTPALNPSRASTPLAMYPPMTRASPTPQAVHRVASVATHVIRLGGILAHKHLAKRNPSLTLAISPAHN